MLGVAMSGRLEGIADGREEGGASGMENCFVRGALTELLDHRPILVLATIKGQLSHRKLTIVIYVQR